MTSHPSSNDSASLPAHKASLISLFATNRPMQRKEPASRPTHASAIQNSAGRGQEDLYQGLPRFAKASSAHDTSGAAKRERKSVPSNIWSQRDAYHHRTTSTKPEDDRVARQTGICSLTSPSPPLVKLPTGQIPAWEATVYVRFDSPALRSESTWLNRISDPMAKWQNGQQKQDAENNIRHILHQMGVASFNGKEKEVIKRSRLFGNGMFDNLTALDLPRDILDIATALWERWWSGDTNPSMIRGLISVSNAANKRNDSTRNTSWLETAPGFENRDSDCSGHNGLYNGQWWPRRMCAVRDGAHGEREAGIAGPSEHGAFSVVLNGGGYADEDYLTRIRYCGTPASEGFNTTPSTQLMIKAYGRGNEIRVIRGHNAGTYGPSKGYRYDGLYRIISSEVLNPKVKLHRFEMVRVQGQQPVCWKGETMRPHRVEERAMETDGMVGTYSYGC